MLTISSIFTFLKSDGKSAKSIFPEALAMSITPSSWGLESSTSNAWLISSPLEVDKQNRPSSTNDVYMYKNKYILKTLINM